MFGLRNTSKPNIRIEEVKTACPTKWSFSHLSPNVHQGTELSLLMFIFSCLWVSSLEKLRDGCWMWWRGDSDIRCPSEATELFVLDFLCMTLSSTPTLDTFAWGIHHYYYLLFSSFCDAELSLGSFLALVHQGVLGRMLGFIWLDTLLPVYRQARCVRTSRGPVNPW